MEELTRELDDLRHQHNDRSQLVDKSSRRHELEQQLVILKEVTTKSSLQALIACVTCYAKLFLIACVTCYATSSLITFNSVCETL